jgi:hypothetical protein
MIRARTPMAAALQRPATRIGALGEDRPLIGIGTTDRPRLVSRLLLQADVQSQPRGAQPAGRAGARLIHLFDGGTSWNGLAGHIYSGAQIPNWVLVLGAVVIFWLIYRYA